MQDVYFQFTAMDTTVEIAGVSSSDWQKKQNEIEVWFEQFENICSRFCPHSELSILNQQPKDTVIQIHPILFQIIEKAMKYAYKTDFFFNPFIGSALREYGYDTTFSEVKDKHALSHEHDLLNWNDYEPVILLPKITAIIKKVDEDIDLGGIAKGWSVDAISQYVQKNGLKDGIVNAGGDLFIWGDSEKTIGVQHPLIKDKDMVQFRLCNGGVATSNTLYRSWKVGNSQVHHIFNGKKGSPSQCDIIQATAFSTNATEADVIAKVLCMHSFNDAIQWLATYFPHAACILINKNGQMAISPSIKNYVTKVVM